MTFRLGEGVSVSHNADREAALGHIDVGNDPDSGVVPYLFPELVGRPQLRDPATRG